MTQALRVLLVDDHVLYRSGLASLMATRPVFKLVGEAGNGSQAVEMTKRLKPDVVVMDIHMPECNGLEATRTIRREMPWIKVVMLSVSDEDEYLFEAMKSGALGYLLKTLDPVSLFGTLKSVCRGEPGITRQMASRILREFERREDSASREGYNRSLLSTRERKVLESVAQGTPIQEVAKRHGTTEKVVKNLLRNVLDKLQDESLLQAVG